MKLETPQIESTSYARVMFTQLPEPPCTDCPMAAMCKAQLLACKPFRSYVNGRKKYGRRNPTLEMHDEIFSEDDIIFATGDGRKSIPKPIIVDGITFVSKSAALKDAITRGFIGSKSTFLKRVDKGFRTFMELTADPMGKTAKAMV